MGARDDHRANRGVGEALELRCHPLDRTAGLGVGVKEVTGDEDEVDLLGERDVDGCPEGRELALPLDGRLLAEVGVAGPEVNVGRVKKAQHRGHCVKSGRARRGRPW